MSLPTSNMDICAL